MSRAVDEEKNRNPGSATLSVSRAVDEDKNRNPGSATH